MFSLYGEYPIIFPFRRTTSTAMAHGRVRACENGLTPGKTKESHHVHVILVPVETGVAAQGPDPAFPCPCFAPPRYPSRLRATRRPHRAVQLHGGERLRPDQGHQPRELLRWVEHH